MKRNRQDAGAALVELSLCMVLLTGLALGVAEYGSVYASAIDASAGVRSAAAIGASTTDEPASDRSIIDAALDHHGGTPRNIDRIVIYKASAMQAGPPAACISETLTASYVAGLCNVYRSGDLALTEPQLAAKTANGWPASARQPGQDILGVWVDVARTPMQKLVWAPTKVSDYSASLIDNVQTPSNAINSPTSGYSTGPQSKLSFDQTWMNWNTYQGGSYNGGSGGGSGSG